MWNSFSPVYYEVSNHAQVIQFRFPAQFDGAIYDSDEFRMYSFKIKHCPRLRSHDWTQCPFAHRGERAARRDPRRFNYCAVPCPDFRDIGTCFRGEACLYAHGVFEQWLHPERYRTRLCSAGLDCQRQVCFFAHTIGELRAEEPPKFEFHHDRIPQPWPEIPTQVPIKVINNNQVCDTSSPVALPTFPNDVLSAFKGGNDFLASLSGVRVKENEKRSREIFGGFVAEQNAPNISWVEEVVVE